MAKVIITVKEAIDKGIWIELTELLGINPWAYNEGLISGDHGIELTEEQALELGLMKGVK